MKYRVIIKPKPVTIEVETFSGPDVAEERARQIFNARLRADILDKDGSTNQAWLPLYDADHSDAEVLDVSLPWVCSWCANPKQPDPEYHPNGAVHENLGVD